MGVEYEAQNDEEGNTNVDGLNPLGSLISRKRSPLLAHAGVLAQCCADRCHSRADK